MTINRGNEMAKRKTWKSGLTKSELRHLKVDAGVTTKASFQHTINEQQKMRDTGGSEPCWTCKSIAKKIGMVAV